MYVHILKLYSSAQTHNHDRVGFDATLNHFTWDYFLANFMNDIPFSMLLSRLLRCRLTFSIWSSIYIIIDLILFAALSLKLSHIKCFSFTFGFTAIARIKKGSNTKVKTKIFVLWLSSATHRDWESVREKTREKSFGTSEINALFAHEHTLTKGVLLLSEPNMKQ